MEAFRQYTPMDPQAEESRATVLLAFVNRAAPDIRRKLQKIEGLREQTIQDLLKAAEKVFNNREHRAKENRKNQRELAKILFAGIKAGTGLREPRGPQTGEKARPKRQALKKDQCTYCREWGHWKVP